MPYQLLENAWVPRGWLLGGSLLLPILASRSETIWAASLLGLLVVALSFQLKEKTLVAFTAVFNWALASFLLHRSGSAYASVALLALHITGILTITSTLSFPTARALLFGQALGIVLIELFFVLLFWPINFPSRALVLVIAAFLVVETIDHVVHGTAIKLWPAFLFSGVAIAGIVSTADWFGF